MGLGTSTLMGSESAAGATAAAHCWGTQAAGVGAAGISSAA